MASMNLVFLLLGIFSVYIFRNNATQGTLPPGPFSWPLVGCLLSLRSPLHHHLGKLSKKYGSLMFLRIGMVPYLVVSNNRMAKEILNTQDAEFAYRPATPFFRHFSFHYSDLILAPPDDTWRRLKKITSSYLFSPMTLDATSQFRSSCVKAAISSILSSKEHVNLGEIIGASILDMICLTVFGQKHHDHRQGLQLIEDIANEALALNIGEVFPCLERFDFHGVERRMARIHMPKVVSWISKVIDEHKKAKGREQPQDFTDILLSLQGDDSLSDKTILAILWDMLIAGTETSKVSADWAMRELLNNPEMMSKLQQEVDQVMGNSKDFLVQPFHISQLPYAQAVFKESLRLHDPVPLSVPHFNPKGSVIAGHTIPPKCRVLINAWAILRDPAVWPDADVFDPERFMKPIEKDSFQLSPLSNGRRNCVGQAFANRSVPYILAALVQAFDWSLPPGHEKVSMEESKGLLEAKPAHPLMAVATTRLNMTAYHT